MIVPLGTLPLATLASLAILARNTTETKFIERTFFVVFLSIELCELVPSPS